MITRILLAAARRRQASGYGNGTAIGNAEDIGVGTPSWPNVLSPQQKTPLAVAAQAV